MRYKNQSKILMVFSAFLVITLTSCAMMLSAKNKVPDKVENKSPSEPPNLTVTVTTNGQNIYNEMGKREWNGAKFKRMNPFEYMAKNQKLKDLPYVPFNSFIELLFDGIKPDNITISDMIIDEDGKGKYSEKEIVDIPFDIKNDKGFTLSGHMASILSSNSEDYKPGAVIRGFLIVCSFGENKCDYAFALRTDAGVTTSQITENLSDDEISKKIDAKYAPREDRADPYFWLFKWKWTDESTPQYFI